MGEETMPEMQKSSQLGNAAAALCSPSAAAIGPTSSNGIWSRHREDLCFDQLQKFWNELPPHSRRDLLRIDKQTLFEQARKNLYCSRCNGLLLEGFSQLVMYGKSLQQDGSGNSHSNRKLAEKINGCVDSDDLLDPSVHPWGGLVATRDGMLTLMDSFIYGKSLRPLQNVFDSARARERERELLYPDACGGGGRGWISQGVALYGRGHGTRETCALHTARLSCDTLVDFWSALGEETRSSLLRMKEEDFIERLMYRFDSKRFCRDCRRNVIREFKELKELKRMRKDPRCTSWFCVADTSFQYEVSDGSVQADWHESFKETHGSYHHFEWAIGTAEGKSDILDFEDVGMSGKVQVNGLDLSGIGACFITLRAWRTDGRCTELTVKAHGLKGQPCVHRRLAVGDGYVAITKGESIRRFFEHAEEVEEEEDDDSIDKDGSDLDGDGSRPQKHAKSPELAREFLLDAATVIFKEQVEKAFREGTARQNAHSTFVCLALKLLEERVHVACKEIITWEKQIKLLEEEEREKREEEERRERRRAKEREKKLRRKERLKVKEIERETKNSATAEPLLVAAPSTPLIVEEAPATVDSVDPRGDLTVLADHGEDLKFSSPPPGPRKLRAKAGSPDPAKKLSNGLRFSHSEHRQFQPNGPKPSGPKFNPRPAHDRCGFRACACNHGSKTETPDGPSPARSVRYGRSKVHQVKQVWEPTVKVRPDTAQSTSPTSPVNGEAGQTTDVAPMEEATSSSVSDNCSSCLSEAGDGSARSSSPHNVSDCDEGAVPAAPVPVEVHATVPPGPHMHFPVFPIPAAHWAPLVPLQAQFLVPRLLPHQPQEFSVAFSTPPPQRPARFPGFGPAAESLHRPEPPAKSPSFSLFHFGGPAAAASVSPDRAVCVDRSPVEAEVEYSLFSSSHGVRFSFLGSMNA
ncbi:uncharacterized protein LOC144713553 [Wolffia australiana]